MLIHTFYIISSSKASHQPTLIPCFTDSCHNASHAAAARFSLLQYHAHLFLIFRVARENITDFKGQILFPIAFLRKRDYLQPIGTYRGFLWWPRKSLKHTFNALNFELQRKLYKARPRAALPRDSIHFWCATKP